MSDATPFRPDATPAPLPEPASGSVDPDDRDETPALRRVAMISVHTSPLATPGTGDAGGLNVYVVETAKRLAARGIEVEIFTRAVDGSTPDQAELAPGVLVHQVPAGPYEGLSKNDLPGQLCAFAAGVMRIAAGRPEHWYDLVHSHYWLSGQVGWLTADRWNVPLVHTMHTMARVKNAHLAHGDSPEPAGREIGEAQVVEAAGSLVANTVDEARQLVELYDARPDAVQVVHPGVDLDTFTPGDVMAARERVGLPAAALVLLFVGRLQPLKAPDVVIRAVGELARSRPDLAERLVVPILGGPSGDVASGNPEWLLSLARQEGVADLVRFVPPVSRAELADWYRAADMVAVPSYSESFGLVAVEALASGTPVVAAQVGGLPYAIGDGGVLVPDHEPATWATQIAALLDDPARLAELAERGLVHAKAFSWEHTVDALEVVYREAIRTWQPAPIAGAANLVGIPRAVVP